MPPPIISFVTPVMRRKGFYIVTGKNFSYWSKTIEHNGQKIGIEITGPEDIAPQSFDKPAVLRAYDAGTAVELTNKICFDSLKDCLGVNIDQVVRENVDKLMEEI